MKLLFEFDDDKNKIIFFGNNGFCGFLARSLGARIVHTEQLIASLLPEFFFTTLRAAGVLPDVISRNANVFFVDVVCHCNTP